MFINPENYRTYVGPKDCGAVLSEVLERVLGAWVVDEAELQCAQGHQDDPVLNRNYRMFISERDATLCEVAGSRSLGHVDRRRNAQVIRDLVIHRKHISWFHFSGVTVDDHRETITTLLKTRYYGHVKLATEYEKGGYGNGEYWPRESVELNCRMLEPSTIRLYSPTKSRVYSDPRPEIRYLIEHVLSIGFTERPAVLR